MQLHPEHVNNGDEKVFMITGLGAKATCFAPFIILSRMFTPDYFVEYVDGASWADERLTAASPLDQTEKVLDKTSAENKLLIISHSIGIVAAVRCLQERPLAKGIAIAPPLPSPAEGVRHEVFLSRLKQVDNGFTFPTYSFAPENSHQTVKKGKQTIDVFVPAGYFAEVDAVSKGFGEQVEQLTDEDRLRIVAATHDWNTLAIQAAERYKGTSFVEAPHSLYTPEDKLGVVCAAIYQQAKALDSTAINLNPS